MNYAVAITAQQGQVVNACGAFTCLMKGFYMVTFDETESSVPRTPDIGQKIMQGRGGA